MDKWRHTAFLETDEDPLGPMANLVDVVLVFACGLIAALVSLSPELQTHFQQANEGSRIEKNISLSRELPTVPESISKMTGAGAGFESLGQVYRDPKTGKLILIGQ